MDKEFPCIVVQKPVDEAALVAAGVVPAPTIQYARAPAAPGSLPTARLPVAQGSVR